MRSQPMSNQEYDGFTKSSKGFLVQGSIAEYRRLDGFKSIALRVPGGIIFGFHDFKLWVGGCSCGNLPVGTRVTIDIPPGVTPPFNRFVEYPMKFQYESDDGVEWIDD